MSCAANRSIIAGTSLLLVTGFAERVGATTPAPREALSGGCLKRQDRVPEIYFYEWSVNRWRSSETRSTLSLAGRGLYRELLDLCYTQGSITANFQILASQVGCAPIEIEQNWPLIKRHFQRDPHDPTRLRNKVADVYRKQYFSYISAQKAFGAVGGKRKAQRINEMSRGTASLEENRTYTEGIECAAPRRQILPHFLGSVVRPDRPQAA